MIPLFKEFDNYNIVNATQWFKEHLPRTQLLEGLFQAGYKLQFPSNGNLQPFPTALTKVLTSKPTAKEINGED